MIQRVKKPIKFCWLLSAIVIVAFAVLLQLLKWSLPHLNSFNESLARYASQQVNSEVTLGHISSTWTGLRPEVVVDDLSIKTNDGQTVLAIKQASMQLDILRSLYHWTPVWRSVEAEQVQLHVTQDEKGGWSIGGLSPARGDRSWRYRSPSALFLMAGNVDLTSSTVIFNLHDQRQIKTDIPIITIQNNGHFHRLNAKAAIGDNSAFNFILEGVGDPSIPDQFFAQAYLRLNRFPVEKLAHLWGQATAGIERQAPIQLAESEANLEMWFDFATPSRFLMNGHVELINEDSSAFAKKYYLDIPVKAAISGDYGIKTGLAIGLRDVHIDKTLAIQKAHVLVHDKKLTIAVDDVEVRDWVRWGEKRLIRSDEINKYIANLAPEGKLKNIYSTIDLLNPLGFELSANITGGHTQAWRGVPEFKKVSGYVETGLNQGFVLLDANDFSLFPDEVYNAPLTADYASGYVSWALNHQKKRVKVQGYELKMLGDYGEANGHFSLDLGWKSRKDSKNLILQIGLQNSDATYHKLLVPKILPKPLLSWMSDAIKSGEIKEAGFFYRGGLNFSSERTVQFFADLSQGGLDFSSDWPALNNLEGRFVIDDDLIEGDVTQASIYQGDQFNGGFSWNKNNKNLLEVNVNGTASAQSSFRYLRESWLSQYVGEFITQVEGTGRLAIDVNLGIPLNNSSAPAHQDILISLDNNKLTLKEADLSFESVNGIVKYATQTGFESENLTALLFNKTITAEIDHSESEKVVITGGGEAGLDAVALWLKQPILSFVSGEMAYNFKIELPAKQSELEPNMLLTSNLLGVNADLPKPFDKKADQELAFKLMMPFNKENTEFKLTLGSYLSSHFIYGKDQTPIATLAISDTQFPELTTLPDAGIKLVSQFSRLYAREWLQFIQQYRQAGDSGDLDVDVFLSVDELLYNNYQFKNIMASAHREQSGWSLFVDSDDVLGGIYVDDDKARPLIIDIDYLHWPPTDLSLHSVTEKGVQTSFFDEIDPRSLPFANLKINRLVYKEKPLGSWSMELRPDTEGLIVNNIVASINGFVLSGDKEKKGASLQWQAASDSIPESTHFEGIVFGENPKTLFEQWDLPFGLESKEAQLIADLFWLGAPADFAVEKLEGKVNILNKKGVFIQDKTNEAVGVLKLFGLLNFDSWARRVRLDFSDVYKKGLVFDELTGELTFDHGLIELSEPMTMQGPSSKMALSGSIDYVQQTVDTRLVATLPIGGNLTVVAALVGGLPAAAGVYLVGKLFEKQVEKVSSVNYVIRGNWADPVINVEKLGDETISPPVVEEGS